MRGSSVDTSTPFTSLPFVLDQRSTRSSPLVLTSVLVPLLAGLAFPFALLGFALFDDPHARAAVLERPFSAVQVFFASVALLLIFGWPLLRLISSLAGGRVARISGETVTVTERGLFGSGTWEEPLQSYSGVAHRVGSSISGVRHELLLVHPDHRRTVLLWVAPRIDQSEVERTAQMLNLAEISSRDASSHEPLRRRLGPSRPQPRLAVASLAVAET